MSDSKGNSVMLAIFRPEQYLDTAIDALGHGEDRWRPVLDALPVPIYTADTDGLVTYWNRACVEFAGREPELGQDRWCVTWRIHTPAGDHLPHDRCPMAVAINQSRAVRGEIAIAMRPDGSRKAFTPYPTPLFDEAGALTGAINMLIDVSAEQATVLASQADRCRRLAQSICDTRARALLLGMADGYRRNAAALSG